MVSFPAILLWTSGVLYVLSSFLYVALLFGRIKRVDRYVSFLLLAGFLLHTLVLVFRTVQSGHLPFADLSEALSTFVWLLIAVYLFLIERVFREKALGAFVTPVASVFYLFSAARLSAPKELAPLLRTDWFGIHVLLALLAYASFALTFVTSTMYLIQTYQIRSKKTGMLFSRLPSLQLLDSMGHRSVSLGFSSLTLAMIVGSIWASNAWGSFWRWDPKETSTLVTWLVYGAYLHARFVAGWQGRRTAILGVVGFAMVLTTFLVISVYFTKLHVF